MSWIGSEHDSGLHFDRLSIAHMRLELPLHHGFCDARRLLAKTADHVHVLHLAVRADDDANRNRIELVIPQDRIDLPDCVGFGRSVVTNPTSCFRPADRLLKKTAQMERLKRPMGPVTKVWRNDRNPYLSILVNAECREGRKGKRRPKPPFLSVRKGYYCGVTSSTMMPMFLAPLARARSRNLMIDS